MEIKILKTFQQHGAGWVHAGETRTESDDRAKELIRNGLAAEVVSTKKAPEVENKKAAEPDNKGRAAATSKGGK